MSNTFGTLFRITTWGESHGKAIGVVIDGCPAGLRLCVDDINCELEKRRPGKKNTSPRNEPDIAKIYSGVFEGKTTGAPISIIIENKDVDSKPYEAIKDIVRPGHANKTYVEKYGIFDYRGGGRASARETACRVAAGAVAKKLLALLDVSLNSSVDYPPLVDKDSVGGVVTLTTSSLPAGLGNPVYEKLEAKLASAMLSIPATKGFEIDMGFKAAEMVGSDHNCLEAGTLGGISTGHPLTIRVAFKPTSSIKQRMETVTLDGKKTTFSLPQGSKHDPCVAIRGRIVVEAMCALVLADALLLAGHARVERVISAIHHMEPLQ